MTDTTPIDVAPLLERHDRKSRWTFFAMLSLSLVLAALIFAAGMRPGGSPGDVVDRLWMQILMGPLIVGTLWIASALYGRTRPLGPLPMSADDARNVRRVAHAGYVFVTGFGAVMIAGQASWLLSAMGVLPAPDEQSSWGVRAVLVALGALTVYFGNVSPRMPTPRTPEAKPAVRMKYNRLGGWMTVVLGLLLALAALFLPLREMIFAVAGLSVAVLVATAVGAVMYYGALRSPNAR